MRWYWASFCDNDGEWLCGAFVQAPGPYQVEASCIQLGIAPRKEDFGSLMVCELSNTDIDEFVPEAWRNRKITDLEEIQQTLPLVLIDTASVSEQDRERLNRARKAELN